MGIESGRMRVADLNLQVFGSTIHPDFFRVKSFRRLVQTCWEADIRIIEGGHAIQWSCGSVRVAEVLTRGDVEWPEPGPLYRSPLRQERSTSLTPAPGLEYQTCFAVERMDLEVFRHLNDELTLDAGGSCLFHLEQPSSRLSRSPLSRIQVEARPRYLSVQSFHTSPDERAIVRTQSLFELRRPQGG